MQRAQNAKIYQKHPVEIILLTCLTSWKAEGTAHFLIISHALSGLHYSHTESVIFTLTWFLGLRSLPWHVDSRISLLQGGADSRVNHRPKVSGRGGGGWAGARDVLKVNQRTKHRR